MTNSKCEISDVKWSGPAIAVNSHSLSNLDAFQIDLLDSNHVQGQTRTSNSRTQYLSIGRKVRLTWCS
jgi:hypothetical protein